MRAMSLTKEAIAEAVRKAIELGKGRRFKQSVELQVIFKGVSPKDPEVKFRENVVLPKGTGKRPKILVIATGEMLLKARELGVDALRPEDVRTLSRRELKKIGRNYDWVLVRADLMAQMGRVVGPVLGPRGKAPIPVPMSADIGLFIRRFENSVRLRNKEQAWVGCRIGTEDMSPEDLAENAMAVIERIKAKFKRPLETSARIYVKTTMGPPVEVVM